MECEPSRDDTAFLYTIAGDYPVHGIAVGLLYSAVHLHKSSDYYVHVYIALFQFWNIWM